MRTARSTPRSQAPLGNARPEAVLRRLRRSLVVLCCCALPGCGSKVEPLRAKEEPAVENRVALFGPGSPVETETRSFQFARDGIGKLLREKLTPGVEPVADPVPFVGEPQRWRSARLADRAVRHEFPSALAVAEPRVPALERPGATRPRRVVDVPPLADPDPALPDRVHLPTGPRAFAVGPDPAQLPVGELMPPLPFAALPAADPTLELSRQAALKPIADFRSQPAPFTQEIASESSGLARLPPGPLAESDPPAIPTSRPVPTLPVK
jgi:hypothetical protein